MRIMPGPQQLADLLEQFHGRILLAQPFATDFYVNEQPKSRARRRLQTGYASEAWLHTRRQAVLMDLSGRQPVLRRLL